MIINITKKKKDDYQASPEPDMIMKFRKKNYYQVSLDST